MTDEPRDIVIPKEQATFWLDGRGYWNNRHGRFERRRIIDYFHASIKKDRDGYYLEQSRGEFREKVYFPYEDTALFVFDFTVEDEMFLVLNTGEKLVLDPTGLFIKNDHLYFSYHGETIKFTEKTMMAISRFLDESEEGLVMKVNNRTFRVKEI